ncbi:MAG: carboxypeptidase-like regulatory domain-containing protein, partial [Ginsengibacter sp.]
MYISTNAYCRKYISPKILLLFFLWIAFVPVTAFSQKTAVTGHVQGTDGLPISAASILEQNTTNGTTTDGSGNFSLSVNDPNAILIITSLGYTSQVVSLSGRTNISIILVGSVTQLEQVVIIGYGSQRKKDLTGASASVKGADIVNVPALTATQAIQGKVAGVQIVSSGAPGSAPDVRIRGVGSILGGAAPLYVV